MVDVRCAPRVVDLVLLFVRVLNTRKTVEVPIGMDMLLTGAIRLRRLFRLFREIMQQPRLGRLALSDHPFQIPAPVAFDFTFRESVARPCDQHGRVDDQFYKLFRVAFEAWY